MNPIYAGLVVWLITVIITESFLFEKVRAWAAQKTTVWPIPSPHDLARVNCEAGGGMDAVRDFLHPPRRPHLAYLVECHLCCGVWVGFVVASALAIFAGSSGPTDNIILDGLLFKAIGHLTFAVQKVLERVSS